MIHAWLYLVYDCFVFWGCSQPAGPAQQTAEDRGQPGESHKGKYATRWTGLPITDGLQIQRIFAPLMENDELHADASDYRNCCVVGPVVLHRGERRVMSPKKISITDNVLVLSVMLIGLGISPYNFTPSRTSHSFLVPLLERNRLV